MEGATSVNGLRVMVGVLEPAARHRKVTICARVQDLYGEKVVAEVPLVMLLLWMLLALPAAAAAPETTVQQNGIYTIYFETGGGVGIPVIASTTSTGRLNSLPTPTMSGYTFEGWYTDQLEGDKITVNTEFGADTTIYAHWVPNASDKTPAVTKPGTASTDGFAWKAHVGTMLVAGTILLTMAVLYLR